MVEEGTLTMLATMIRYLSLTLPTLGTAITTTTIKEQKHVTQRGTKNFVGTKITHGLL